MEQHPRPWKWEGETFGMPETITDRDSCTVVELRWRTSHVATGAAARALVQRLLDAYNREAE